MRVSQACNWGGGGGGGQGGMMAGRGLGKEDGRKGPGQGVWARRERPGQAGKRGKGKGRAWVRKKGPELIFFWQIF